MNDDDFGSLTIIQFEKLLDRKTEAGKREFLLSGIVAAAIYNSNPWRGEKSTPVSPLDFVPGENSKQEQSVEEQIAILRQTFGNKKHGQ